MSSFSRLRQTATIRARALHVVWLKAMGYLLPRDSDLLVLVEEDAQSLAERLEP